MPDCRPRAVRLWWPVPLALIVWLVLMWKFGAFLSAPQVETGAPAPIEARFVELPEAVKLPSKRPEVQPKSPPRPASKPRIKSSPVSRSESTQAAKPNDPAPEQAVAPPQDLMAYVNAARERRQAAEASAQRENAQATARERVPTADEVRAANIKRNLQPQGTNGVFQIVEMSVRKGKFLFRGWAAGSNPMHETIEVDAGAGGDLERAMVRSMLALIRRYYKGDFNWESQRLDRTVVLSARLEDNAGLEDFLIKEFFAPGVRLPGPASRNGFR